MPDHDFTPAQVDALLDYVSTVQAPAADTRVGGNRHRRRRSPRLRSVRRTRAVDHEGAVQRLSQRASSLVGWTTTMATFAPELSFVYDRYQDKPLAAFLRATVLCRGGPRRRSRTS